MYMSVYKSMLPHHGCSYEYWTSQHQLKIKINLTQLRRNTRSRTDKKSRRKAPRAGDYEVVPAPDARHSRDLVI